MPVRTGSVGWTTWALPVLIICNLAVRRLTVTRPERARMWSRLATLVTLTMLAVIVTATFLR